MYSLYFQEAIDWLSNHRNVSSGGIGVVGYSKGADLAIYMSTISEKVRIMCYVTTLHCTVALNGRGVNIYYLAIAT